MSHSLISVCHPEFNATLLAAEYVSTGDYEVLWDMTPCRLACMYICMYVFFFNIYLQHVPLPGNTTCSSIHLIH
jgi:hypothetical protein